jgi:uncharacterized membrane protein (UPF0127 family)
MRGPIDLIFLDARLRVVRVVDQVRPGRVIWRIPGAHSVLELPASVIRSSETQIGDQVEFVQDLRALRDKRVTAERMDGKHAP